MSNLTANNLSVSGTATVNSILASGNIQTTANIVCNDLTINGTGNLGANNLNITGLLNNTITTSNLLSLDTTSSINTSLNSINSNISAIQSQQQTDINSITNLNNEVAILNSHYKSDTSGNLTITTNEPNTNISMANGNGQELSLYNGTLNLTNNDTSADIQFQITDTNTNNKIIFAPINNYGGDYNSLAIPGSSIMGCTQPLCLFQNGINPSGLILSQNNILMKSGNLTNNNYFYIDSSGIGVNTQTPAYPLDVNGTIGTNLLETSQINSNSTSLNLGIGGSNNFIISNGNFLMQNSENVNSIEFTVKDVSSGNYLSIVPNVGYYGYSGLARGGDTLIYTGSSMVLAAAYTASSGIQLNTDNSVLIGGGNSQTILPQNYFYFDASGIGLNTQTPAYQLDVNGDVNCSGTIYGSHLNLHGTDIQTEITTNTNNISTLQTYINGISNNLKNVSGNIELISSNSASNYIYIDSAGIGINKNNPSNTLDVNGDVSIGTNAIGSLATYLTNLTNQINSINTTLTNLNNASAKAYGYYSPTGGYSGTYNVKTSYVSTYPVVQNGISGISIILNNYTGIQGIVNATPADSNGYTCIAQYSFANLIVGVQNGGSSPSYINAAFYFVVY